MRWQHFWISTALALVVCVAGCGGGGDYAPVSGQIVFPDGAPVTGLEGGTIVFEAAGADGKLKSASGAIDSHGKFTLGTESVSDGAVPGKHKVLITPPPSTGDVPLPAVVDPKYESFETSGLEIEVQDGKNDVKVTVEPAK